jgi:plasmid stability protein
VGLKTTITLNVDDELRRRLQQRASRDGKPLESEAADLLRAAVGLGPDAGPQDKAGIERFVGMWSRQEAEEFESSLFSDIRRIDPELWA